MLAKVDILKIRKILTTVGILMVVLGCGITFPTAHSDAAKNNAATYKTDLKDCAQSYPETPDGAYLKRRIACMELKGWK